VADHSASTVNATWNAIADRVDRPRRTLAERVLARVLPDHTARLVAATSALRWSWMVAVAGVVAAFVLLARYAGSDGPFFAVAPLVPLAGVAASFGPMPDPAGETALAAPMYGVALVLWRAVAVLATSLVVLAVGSLALPGFGLGDLAWALPAIALSCAALTLSTWVTPFTATALAAFVWTAAVAGVPLFDGASRAVAHSSLFRPVGQLGFLGLLAATLLVANARRAKFSTLEVR